jgi:hypothetical protein
MWCFFSGGSPVRCSRFPAFPSTSSCRIAESACSAKPKSRSEPSPMPYIVILFGFSGKCSIGELWQSWAAGDTSALGKTERATHQSPCFERSETRSNACRTKRPSDQPSGYHLGPCSRPAHGARHSPAYNPQPCDRSAGEWYLPESLFWLTFSLLDASTLATASASQILPADQIRPQRQYPPSIHNPLRHERECFPARLMSAPAEIGRFGQEVAVWGRWICDTLGSPTGSLSRLVY